jgi:hypothetical protein
MPRIFRLQENLQSWQQELVRQDSTLKGIPGPPPPGDLLWQEEEEECQPALLITTTTSSSCQQLKFTLPEVDTSSWSQSEVAGRFSVSVLS